MNYNTPSEEYKPHFNELLVKQFIEQIDHSPESFKPELIAQVQQDASHYGILYHGPETDITLSGTLKQAGAGFISGFTTFNVGDDPTNVSERIARNIGSLAGFLGYLPALPAKAGALAKAASFLKGKSIPMLVSGKATELVRKTTSDITRKAATGRAGAFSSAAQFLQREPVKDTLEGAFHLGVASSVSAWQGGIDEMMRGFVGGAQTGGAFRLIGNLVRLPGTDLPKFGAKWGDLTPGQQGEKSIQMLASSLYDGLPATMRGETAPEQIYSYLMGAYFGMNEGPREVRQRDKQVVEIFRGRNDGKNPLALPELSPGWNKLTPEVQNLVRKERDSIFNQAGDIISAKAQQFLGQSLMLPEIDAEFKASEALKPKNTTQFEVRNRLFEGTDISTDIWKTLSKEDKAYYGNAVDNSPIGGAFKWAEIIKWEPEVLKSVAEKLGVDSSLPISELASEIMYNQPKASMEVALKMQLANEAENVLVDHQDISENIDIDRASVKSTTFVEKYLAPFFENLGAAERLQEIDSLSKLVESKVLEQMGSEKPDSREFMKWAENHFKMTFPTEAEGGIRQWMKRATESKQVPFLSPRIIEEVHIDEHSGREYTTETIEVDFLATSGTPVDRMGNRKALLFPENRLDMVWNELRGTESAEPAYMISDGFISSNRNGQRNVSWFRQKEALERSYPDVIEGHVDSYGNPVKEGTERYNAQVFDIFNKMSEKGYFYFGGAGDKERAYFVKKHPGATKNLDYKKFTGQLGEILRTISPTKHKELFKLSEEAFLNRYLEYGKREGRDTIRKYHADAFVSNFIWDMQMNGFALPTEKMLPSERQLIYSKALASGMISNAKDYNKRAQIWFTNGYRVDSEYVNSLLPENMKLTDNGEYKVLIVPDAPGKGLTDIARAIDYTEATDGGVLTHDKLMEIEAREAGMPEPSEQGQSKSFIVSPNERRGAMLGKYMKHAAGDKLSEMMENYEYTNTETGEVTKGVHMIMYESAIKQLGDRKPTDYSVDNEQLTSEGRIYHYKPEHQHTVLSELQNAHNIEPHHMPSQMFGNLASSTLYKELEPGVFDDMFNTLVNESYQSTNKAFLLKQRMLEPGAAKDKAMNNEFLKNFDQFGVEDVIEILMRPDFSHMHDKIYQKITKIVKEDANRKAQEGEQDFQSTSELLDYVEEFTSATDRFLKIGAKLEKEYGVPTISTFLHKWTKPYVEVIMNNWVVHKATRPKIGNSASARMRPYDKQLQSEIESRIDRHGKLHGEIKENEFYLDNYFKKMQIDSGRYLKERTLGEISDLYFAGRYSKSQEKYVETVFAGLTMRVPMDSVSGARAMNFRGFTNRKGHGILLHPRAMRAEGGADLDGDKAFVFFGGRDADGRGNGMKQSWINMYKSNQKEFTRYRDKKTGEVITQEAIDYDIDLSNKTEAELDVLYERYTTDNKTEPLLHGPDADGTTTARDVFTLTSSDAKFTDALLHKDTQNEKGMLFYSPFARARMSEAASVGRMMLGNVVIMKKNLAGAHSMIAANGGVETAYHPLPGEIDLVYNIVAKTGSEDMELFRQLSRTGVALGSDPMNEIGLGNYNLFFNKMWDSLFELQPVSYIKDGIEVTDYNKVYELFDKSFPTPKNEAGEDVYTEPGFDRFQKLKKKGAIGQFWDANNAYWGRNHGENRRHTLNERKDKAQPLARREESIQNTVQPKVARLLDGIDYNDGILKRIKPEALDKLYSDYKKILKEFSFMRPLLERKGFAVEKSDYIDAVLKTKLWLPEELQKFVMSTDKFNEFFYPEGGKDLPATQLIYKNPHVASKEYSFKETITGESDTQTTKEGQPLRIWTGRTPGEWKRFHLEAALEKGDHMLQADLADMMSTKRLAKLAKTVSADRFMEITKMASNIRGLDVSLNRNRKKLTIDENDAEYEKQADADLRAIHRLNPQDGAMATHAEIQREIVKAKEGLNAEEVTLFDEFMLGTLNRSNKALIESKKEELIKKGTLTYEYDKWLDKQKERTDNTSLNKFGLKSEEISDASILSWLKDYNDLFNTAMELPTSRAIEKITTEATELSTQPQRVESTTGEKVEVDMFEDPYAGLRGLKDDKLDSEGTKIMSELEGHLDYYHNSIGKNLSEIVGGLVGRDLNAMTYEDWRNVNNYFKNLRTQSTWDRLFNSFTKGKPEIMKRYWHLFPKTIDRKLMAHDFQLMLKSNKVYTKDGTYRDAVVATPIHQMGKAQAITASVQQSIQSAAEEETANFRAQLDPLYEGVVGGKEIYNLAVTEAEMGVVRHLEKQAVNDPENARKYHGQASAYKKAYESLRKELNEPDIMAKIYEVPMVDVSGNSVKKKMTGQEYKKEIQTVLKNQAETMHKWLVGEPGVKERFLLRDSKGRVKSFHEKGEAGFEMYDVNKFINAMERLMLEGRDIPRNLGMDLVNGMVRQFQYETAKPEHREMLARQRFLPTESIPSEHYFPHIMLDAGKASQSMMRSIKDIIREPSAKSSEQGKAARIQKLLFQHRQMTGDWISPEMKQWELYDEVKRHLKNADTRPSDEMKQSYGMYARPGMTKGRDHHAEGWSRDPRVYDRYIRQVFGSYYRSLGQLVSRHSLNRFVSRFTKQWGPDLTEAWEKFIGIYINNANGFPATLPQEYLNDPYLNVKGTPYAWWADNNVKNKINKILDKLEISDKELPDEIRGATLNDLRNWTNLEARYQMAALLSHPKTAIGNIYGGTALTIANTGFGNFRKARNINFLRNTFNPGKDKFGNEWHSLSDITKYITNLGVMPEMIAYESGMSLEVKKANAGEFVDAAIKKIQKDPTMSDKSLKGLADEYGITEGFWDKAAWFMKTSERALRRDSFMAHMVQAYESYGGALAYDHPIIIEMAKKGVKATQFLYNAPHRPMFAQTQLGKILTRFQLWSWNSVRFRNDVIRGAERYGWREGTPEFERYRRTAQIDMLMLALSSVFTYSLFEAALPAPWNWYQDTADWIFGDEEERDRAFFGAWPSEIAPLQMVTPPVLRFAPATFKGLVEQDFSKLSDYIVWTMFPFGRIARDIAGPNNIIENPSRSVEKLTGLPYLQFGREVKEEREKGQLFPKGLITW